MRHVYVLVAVATVAAAAATASSLLAVMHCGPSSDREGPSAAWEHWRSLPPSQRAAYVRSYQEIDRQPDGAEILEHAREFAGLPSQEQERLRRLWQLYEDTVRAQPASERHWLLSLPPKVRAVEVYRVLAANAADELALLRSSRTR